LTTPKKGQNTLNLILLLLLTDGSLFTRSIDQDLKNCQEKTSNLKSYQMLKFLVKKRMSLATEKKHLNTWKTKEMLLLKITSRDRGLHSVFGATIFNEIFGDHLKTGMSSLKKKKEGS